MIGKKKKIQNSDYLWGGWEEVMVEEAKSGGWVVGTELSTSNTSHSTRTLVCARMPRTITSS